MVKMADLSGLRYFVADIEIEDGVPIESPDERRERLAAVYRAAAKMKVGQSILIPAERAGISSNLARKTGFKFTQRVYKRGPNAGMMRIWRIE